MKIKNIAKYIATCYPIGFLKAPGTLASFITILIVIYFNILPIYSFICFNILLLIGLITTKIYLNNNNNKDPQEIVIDEVCATFLLCSFLTNQQIIVGFLIFRVIDIFKLFGCKTIENKFKDEYGVMFDDIWASICSIFIVNYAYKITKLFQHLF